MLKKINDSDGSAVVIATRNKKPKAESKGYSYYLLTTDH